MIDFTKHIPYFIEYTDHDSVFMSIYFDNHYWFLTYGKELIPFNIQDNTYCPFGITRKLHYKDELELYKQYRAYKIYKDLLEE